MNISDLQILPSKGRTSRIAAAVVAALLGFTGCGGTESDSGRIEVSEVRVDDERGECIESAFPLKPSFFAARERIDSVGVFLQSAVGLGQDADVVYFELFRPEEIRENSGTPVSFGGPPDASTSVRGEIDLGETCPRLNASFRIQGQIQFSSLSTETGDRVDGELLDGAVVDNRSGETVASSATGQWDFTVRAGTGSEAYPTYEDEYRIDP